MGSSFCCDTKIIVKIPEEQSEIIINSLDFTELEVTKPFRVHPFPNFNSELIEISSERFSEKFKFF